VCHEFIFFLDPKMLFIEVKEKWSGMDVEEVTFGILNAVMVTSFPR